MDDDQLWKRAGAAIDRFGRGATAYDRYRPRFPDEMFDALVDAGALRPGGVVVEVGAGTGLATVGLAERCGTVVGLEPAAGMAAVARAKAASFAGASIVETTFEAWEPTVDDADLVFSANTWQWVDPAVRWAKAAAILRPGGHLALVWQELVGYSPGFADRLAEVGGALNPALAASPTALGIDAQGTWARRAQACGHFGPVTTTRYPFSRHLDASTFVATLDTYGVNRGLSPAKLAETDAALVALIDGEFGGSVEKHEDAVLHLTARPVRTA